MPQRKKPPCLVDLALWKLAAELTPVYKRLSGNAYSSLAPIRTMLDNVPIPILEDLIGHITNLLIGRDRTIIGLLTSFKTFPVDRLSVLDFSRLFSGFRLSRTHNIEFKQFVLQVVGKTAKLTKLVLIGKCTDPILLQLGVSCSKLSELDISYSNDVTAEGLRGLYSVENQIRNKEEKTVKSPQTEGSSTVDGRPRPEGCLDLRVVGLSNCWSVKPCDVADLISHLPKLQLVVYPSMRTVVEHLLNHHQKPPVTYDLDLLECTETKTFLCLKDIPRLFPKLSKVALSATNEDVRCLMDFDSLEDVSLSIYPSTCSMTGFANLMSSGSALKLRRLAIDIFNFDASHLTMIGANCLNLTVFKFIGNVFHGAKDLVVTPGYFNNLAAIDFQTDNGDRDSDDDIDEAQGGEDFADGEAVAPFLINFLLTHSTKIKEIVFRLDLRGVTHEYLQGLLCANPMKKVEKMSLCGTGPSLPLGTQTLELFLECMDSLNSLHISSWRNIDMQAMTERAKEANLDIEFT